MTTVAPITTPALDIAPAPALDTLATLEDLEVHPAFVERIPIAYARRFGIIGLQGGAGVLRLAMAELTDFTVADVVGVHLGLPVEPVLAPAEQITSAINRAYSQQASGVETVIESIPDDGVDAVMEAIAQAGDLLDNQASAPVVKLVNLVLFEAVKRRASDVHVQPFEDRLQIRLRIDGVLYDFVQPPRHLLEEIVSRIKVIGRMNIAEKRLPQDGRTTVSVGERVVDLRISSLPTCHGERVVLRLLDKSARLYRLPELGMNASDLRIFRRLIRHTHGIFLVTGPTGSGKSTTLYAALQELDCTELNILTLEDPIEYQLPGISQTQVSDKKGLTFATGLRTALRQDPDVIMVGEIRDEETARMAVQSSLTGHLVFSTLHTNDAAGAVTRLLDLSIEPYLAASSLLAVLAQRLVRCVCPRCAREEPINEEDLRRLGLQRNGRMTPNLSGTPTALRGSGCAHCLDTGYYERMGIFELLSVNDAIRGLILRRSEAAAIKAAAIEAGMATLRQDALGRLLIGEGAGDLTVRTTVEEVLRVTHEDELET
ncbi:MAG: Flp pilus assembly complex ATPase component [bacterium]|nr:Flp pilus assembly complex ATPase component [bacterium]